MRSGRHEVGRAPRRFQPVGREDALRLRHRVALDAYVLVAPESHLAAVDIAAPAQIGCAAVDHDQFAVVAAMYRRREVGEAQAAVRRRLDPLAVHLAEYAPPEPPRTQSVVYYTYAHSRAGAPHEYSGDGAAYAVVVYDIELDIYFVAGALQIAYYGGEGAVGVVERVDAVAHRHTRSAVGAYAVLEPRAAGRAVDGQGRRHAVGRKEPQQRRGGRRDEHECDPPPCRGGIAAAHDDPYRSDYAPRNMYCAPQSHASAIGHTLCQKRGVPKIGLNTLSAVSQPIRR